MERFHDLRDAFFALEAVQQQVIVGSAVVAGGILMYSLFRGKEAKTVPLGRGWWGEGEESPSEDDQVHGFTVTTSDKEIQDLQALLDQTRYTEPLEDSKFHYGFNSSYLREVVSHWRNEFDWKKQVAILNQYPHFKTNIEGLDVHFIHVRPPALENQKVVPLMLVHGWPGSFYEFYKILPLLTQNRDGIAFEVICPSIPGYGFSEAPHKKGFDSLAAARIFLTLMERLGFSQFYIHGGDWGSLITTNMAQMKPDCVKGLHLTMFMPRNNYKILLSLMVGRYLPFLVGFTREDVRRIYPYFEKNVWEMLRESGYLHIQATKPDTAGCGLNNSPVGLAAYILEKFSSWTDLKNRDLMDGGLERKFSLDDLLTNVMIYWTTGSITSSMRFYKENLSTNPDKRVDALTRVFVPTGYAAFPNELMHSPKTWVQMKFQDLVSYTFMPEGGHFPALEEPRLLADDLFQFVKKVAKV